MKALVVDDNKLARSAIKKLASGFKELEINGESANAEEAYRHLQKDAVDILFLDIQMPGMSGIELLRNLHTKPPVIIITTAKKEYAWEAYELNVADYLLKPIHPVRFMQAVEKAAAMLKLQSREQDNIIRNDYVFIKDSGSLKRLKLDDILFFEAMGDYVKIHTPAKFYTIHSTLKQLEDKLQAADFMRVHRSYIVALDKIEAIEDNEIALEEKFIPVADTYKTALTRKLNLL